MKKKNHRKISLKWGFSITMALCWVVPVLIVVSIAGVLLNYSYDSHIQHTVQSGTNHAMEQVSMYLNLTIEDSKQVSYEGAVRRAYRQYEQTGDTVVLNRELIAYLSQSYSRSQNLLGISLTFLDHPEQDYTYMVPSGTDGHELLREYRRHARAQLMELARTMNTGIRFAVVDGQLYMVRNLLDSGFHPYGVLIMLCNQEHLFQPLNTISTLTAASVTIDGTEILMDPTGTRDEHPDAQELITQYSSLVDGHRLSFQAHALEKNLWGAMPMLQWVIGAVLLLVLPLLAAAFILLYRHVTKPVSTIVEASKRVEAGERGYQIRQIPGNQEFAILTNNFNSLSKELENQFERLYLEQQSLQEARIKALQSQINPHFLGNTLEIINWEARLAENDKVSAMIEALSTMLDAAIGRDGRSILALREELNYAEAYLYIIKERMGDGLHVTKQIDEELLGWGVPRLILQPLVENAVEHDISRRHGTQLWIRARKEDGELVIEVEHEGNISPEDRKNIDLLLSRNPSDGPDKKKVGIRNLNQRIRLICGDAYGLTIRETVPGRVVARVALPFLPVPGENPEVSK